jgi:hypothetical protein
MTRSGTRAQISVSLVLALCSGLPGAQPNAFQPELPVTVDVSAPLAGSGLRTERSARADAVTLPQVLPRVNLFGVDPGAPAAPPREPRPEFRLAQFQLPQAGSREGSGPARQQVEELAKELDY